MSGRRKSPVSRVLLTRQEAAESLGMSLRTFQRHVQPNVRIVAIGQLRLVPPSELDRWIGEHSRDPIG
jgi:excisionase family DNA binding protein